LVYERISMQTTLVYQTDNLESARETLLKEIPNISEVKAIPPMEWKLVCETPVGNMAAYVSGKVVIQSLDEKWAQKVLSILSVEKREEFVPHIGVDEAGKGDFFGPLVTCALYVKDVDSVNKLRLVGVRDSKGISDKSILKLAPKVIKTCPNYSIVSIGAKKLDQMLKKSRNINKVLAWAHAQSIENVLKKVGSECSKVVIDQFSKKKSRILDALKENGSKLEVIQMYGGESDVAVAAASIVARAKFLDELSDLSKKYGIQFPKGATAVIGVAKDYVKQYGKERLSEVAKTSFKITSRI